MSRNAIYKLKTGHRGNGGYHAQINDAAIAPSCVICTKTLIRKDNEMRYKFMARKTCGMVRDETGALVKGQCLREYMKGSGNPNYKGKMPACQNCGKRISYTVDTQQPHKRCKDCFMQWAYKTNWFANTPQIKRLAAKMRASKGQYPEILRPYAFQKGQKAWNKL